jgi:hypothetical protein
MTKLTHVEISKISQIANVKYPHIFYTDSEYKIQNMLFIFHFAHGWRC